MNAMVPITLFGWIPICLAIFLILTPRRAVAVALIGGWLFLPEYTYHMAGIPDYSKATAIAVGLLLGIAFFDPKPLLHFRPGLIDIPIFLWCLVPLASSVSNVLGVYDGISSIIGHTVQFGVPWLVGRIYFCDRAGLNALAVGIFVGGLVYMPFVLFEVRMSPSLHLHIYGYHQHAFIQTYRMGGWRPMVFLEHGLALGMWMTASLICGYWLSHTKARKEIMGLPIQPAVVALAVTTVLCRSAGALGLLAVGMALIIFCNWIRSVLPLLAVSASIPSYLYARIALDWRADPIINLAIRINRFRGNSLAGRIRADAIIAEHAKERLFFGWGGWNRFRLGTGPVLPDTMWAITFGQNGLVGLAALYLTVLLPPTFALWGIRRARLNHPALAGTVALSVIVLLWLCDTMSNRMVSPVYLCAAGGLTGWWRVTTISEEVYTKPWRVPPPIGPMAKPLAATDPDLAEAEQRQADSEAESGKDEDLQAEGKA